METTPSPPVSALQWWQGMSVVTISQMITAAVGFLGITCTLNDGKLDAPRALRWMLLFGLITVTCLLGEAMTAQRLISGG